jgi:vanillate/4-hydroxybenzoate decarboxylase subunit D
MSQAVQSSLPPACPRCRAAHVEVRSTSPIAGVWTVFSCPVCLYSWRSTEPEENTIPDKYPVVFRLKPEDLAKLAVIPTIPPRRPPSGSD